MIHCFRIWVGFGDLVISESKLFAVCKSKFELLIERLKLYHTSSDLTLERERVSQFELLTEQLKSYHTSSDLLITFIPLHFQKKCEWWVAHLSSLYSYNQFWVSPAKKRKKNQKKKKEKEKKGVVLWLFVRFRWCVVPSFVSRLASLARSRLGPA